MEELVRLNKQTLFIDSIDTGTLRNINQYNNVCFYCVHISQLYIL